MSFLRKCQLCLLKIIRSLIQLCARHSLTLATRHLEFIKACKNPMQIHIGIESQITHVKCGCAACNKSGNGDGMGTESD